ncbi:MAG: hypothetical protein ACI9T7_003040 [Oleiphilaceae bacterium]|jgi:hypothetical protein
MVYIVLALHNGALFNENMIYSLFMYCLGIYCFMPVVNGTPIEAPYSGTVLVKGKHINHAKSDTFPSESYSFKALANVGLQTL